MGKRAVYSKIECLDRSEIRKIQLSHLKEQLARCCDFSPFYQQKFRACGFEKNDIEKLEDIKNLPFTYRHELQEDKSRIPPYGGLILPDKKKWAEAHPTTGTTGQQFYAVWTKDDVARITDFTTRMLFSVGVRPGDIIHNSFQYGLRMGGLSVQRVAEKLGCFVLPIGEGPIRTQIEFLVNFRPTVLIGYPTFAFNLAEKLRERGIEPGKLSLRIGCFGGEPGVQVPSTRSRLEQELGIKAYDIYGLVEIGPMIAAECEEQDGLHFAEDYHLVEVINPETLQPCLSDEVGVLVITDLTREAMPLIRYWTNDIVRLSYDRCACGRTHVKLKGGIIGRADDIIIYHGNKFYPAQVENILHRFEELGTEFKVILHPDKNTGMEYCTVKVECLHVGLGIDILEDKIKKELREELKVSVKVELVPFGSLERETLKTKRVLDYRNT